MENKIYNAIQKGIANVLVIDDDASVNYIKSSINNDTVDKITIDDLYNIFLKDNNEIFRQDTRNCISLVLEDNSEISLSAYNGQKICFLKIQTSISAMANNIMYIAIDNNHYIIKERWSTKNKLILFENDHTELLYGDQWDIAQNDFDGYVNSIKISDIFKNNDKLGECPAIDYCLNLTIKLKRKIYRGYLPAIGQMVAINKHIDMLNYILQNIGADKINLPEKFYISSTEMDKEYIWGQGMDCTHTVKKTKHPILPLFRKMN